MTTIKKYPFATIILTGIAMIAAYLIHRMGLFSWDGLCVIGGFLVVTGCIGAIAKQVQ